MSRLLVIEDDTSVRRLLCDLLSGAGYEVSQITDFHSLDQTLSTTQIYNVDLILLDLGLDGLSGLELLRSLREKSSTPVIILTGNTTEANELLAMGYGADDFISKPYHPELLLLRIRAVLRRASGKARSEVYHFAGMEIDLARGVIMQNGRRIHLTKNEMLILRQLLEAHGKIVSREALMTELWNNQEYINDNALTVNISRLRTKLEKFADGETIRTHKGLGYSLNWIER